MGREEEGTGGEKSSVRSLVVHYVYPYIVYY